MRIHMKGIFAYLELGCTSSFECCNDAVVWTLSCVQWGHVFITSWETKEYIRGSMRARHHFEMINQISYLWFKGFNCKMTFLIVQWFLRGRGVEESRPTMACVCARWHVATNGVSAWLRWWIRLVRWLLGQKGELPLNIHCTYYTDTYENNIQY